MGKMPAMQFYPADWRKDLAVQALGYHDRGVWFEILCLMHESSERGVLLLNNHPMSDDVVARLLGLDKQTFNQTLSNLVTVGVVRRRSSDTALFSKRMVQDERLCEIRRQAGRLGGNPVLLKQKEKFPVKQNPTPSASPSTASSSLINTADALGVLEYLNAATSKAFRPVKANIDLIGARLNEGASPDDCRAVVDAKFREWGNDPKWSDYLRPATLFSAKNFANYVGQLSNAAGPVVKDWT